MKRIKTHVSDFSLVVNQLDRPQLLRRFEPRMRENEAFGTYIASALGQLPLKEAIETQNEIQNVLTRCRLSALSTSFSSN